MATVALFDQEVYIDIQRAYDTIVGRLQQQNLLRYTALGKRNIAILSPSRFIDKGPWRDLESGRHYQRIVEYHSCPSHRSMPNRERRFV